MALTQKQKATLSKLQDDYSKAKDMPPAKPMPTDKVTDSLRIISDA